MSFSRGFLASPCRSQAFMYGFHPSYNQDTPLPSIEVKDAAPELIEDIIYVCSWKKLDDRVHLQGLALKRKWLADMIEKYGSIAKVAYLDGVPVASIMYYPEYADPCSIAKREGYCYISCIYNNGDDSQRRGIGTKLVKKLLAEMRKKHRWFEGRRCRCIVADAFDTFEHYPMTRFYGEMGFKKYAKEKGVFGTAMYFELAGKYEPPAKDDEFIPSKSDVGKAVLFFSPSCQYSFPFALKAAKMVGDVVPGYPIELINRWEKPQEYLRRGRSWLVVNGRPVRSFFNDRERFKAEVAAAASLVP